MSFSGANLNCIEGTFELLSCGARSHLGWILLDRQMGLEPGIYMGLEPGMYSCAGAGAAHAHSSVAWVPLHRFETSPVRRCVCL